MPKNAETKAREISTIHFAQGRMKGASSSISKAVPRKLFGMMDNKERCTTDAIVITECGTILDADNSLYILEDNLNCDEKDVYGLSIAGTGITLDCNGKTIAGVAAADFPFSVVGIMIRGDNIVVRNCDITSFSSGIVLGQAGTVTSNILLQNIDSHHNSANGLDFDISSILFLELALGLVEDTSNIQYEVADITVFDSKFNENGRDGANINTRGDGEVKNLIMSGVEANKNGDSGFVLDFITTGRLVDVESNNNGSNDAFIARVGIRIGKFGDTNSNLVIQDSRACDNGETRSSRLGIVDQFSGATFQAISCETTNGKEICSCDCS